MTRRDFDELLVNLHASRARLVDAQQAALSIGDQANADEIAVCIRHIDRTVAHIVIAQSKRNLARAA